MLVLKDEERGEERGRDAKLILFVKVNFDSSNFVSGYVCTSAVMSDPPKEANSFFPP